MATDSCRAGAPDRHPHLPGCRRGRPDQSRAIARGQDNTDATAWTNASAPAIITREEDLYVATCPEVGTVSQGNTVEEAVAALQDATELHLEEFKVDSTSRSILTTFEVAEAAGA